MTHKLQTGNKKVPVDMYSLEGNYIKSFISARDAARYIKKNGHKEIVLCCKGVLNTAYKYSNGGTV